jgi:ParB/RepB/Spo0J family partition protein
MASSASNSSLQSISIEKIDRNPDNPRLVFRPGELEELQESIRLYGIQVPISVYREGGRFVLIDGERRWRCALKLNHKTIPALVQKKPAALENLLMMFNIHALREQWDLLTIALKLPRIIELLTKELERAPTEQEISERTGLKRAIIRRSKLLMNLPDRYKDQILNELEKPKSQQRLTEDLFIELERALTTVERAVPEVIPRRDTVRRALLRKFQQKIIKNRVLFRQVARIARAEKVHVDRDIAIVELNKLFQDNDYTIETAYANSVSEAYVERDIGTRIEGLLTLLEDVDPDEIDDWVREQLERLAEKVTSLLRGAS